jgi:DnaJ domain
VWLCKYWVTSGEATHIRYVRKTLNNHVKKLNAMAGKTGGFHAEATRNAAFRANLNAATDVPWERTMRALHATWDGMLDNHKAFRAFVETETQNIRAENATLTQLCPKWISMLAQYNQVCQEANWLGSQAVLHHLNAVGDRIGTMEALANRSDWTRLALVVDELTQEIQQVHANIRKLEQNPPEAEGSDARNPNAANERDPYAVLGVRPDLPLAQIKEVYRKLAQLYHPDKGIASDRALFQRHQQAWQAIQKQHADRY